MTGLVRLHVTIMEFYKMQEILMGTPDRDHGIRSALRSIGMTDEQIRDAMPRGFEITVLLGRWPLPKGGEMSPSSILRVRTH